MQRYRTIVLGPRPLDPPHIRRREPLELTIQRGGWAADIQAGVVITDRAVASSRGMGCAGSVSLLHYCAAIPDRRLPMPAPLALGPTERARYGSARRPQRPSHDGHSRGDRRARVGGTLEIMGPPRVACPFKGPLGWLRFTNKPQQAGWRREPRPMSRARPDGEHGHAVIRLGSIVLFGEEVTPGVAFSSGASREC